MTDVLFVDEQVILIATALMPSVMAVMNLATLSRTAPTRFLHQGHHANKTDLIQGINIPTPKGKDRTPPIMVPDMRDISEGHSPATIPTATEIAVLEGTPHAPLPATTAAPAALWLIDAAITTCALKPTGIVAPHPTLSIFLTDITHTTPQTASSLAPATPTAQHRNLNPKNLNDTLRPSTPINPTIQRLSPPRIPLQIFHQIRQLLWSFKLLQPSPSSNEDEWGGHSSNHYTIGLILECPTVTVHAGKRSIVLINSGAALSLACSSVYNMIKDHYKTKILSVSSLGKATLHLHIGNFKFSHTFIVCDNYQTQILFWHKYTEEILYHIVGIWINNYSYRGKAHFNLHQELWTAI